MKRCLQMVGWGLIVCVVLGSGLVSSAEREKDNRKAKTTVSKAAVVESPKADKSTQPAIQSSSNDPQTPATSPTPIAKSPMAGEKIDWYVISSGATNASSTNYQLHGTIGQLAVGDASSANYTVKSGFWQNFGTGGCCAIRGDVNHSGSEPDIADVTYLVAFAFKGGPAPPCLDEGDVTGSGGDPDIADVTYLVAYAFKGGPPPPGC